MKRLLVLIVAMLLVPNLVKAEEELEDLLTKFEVVSGTFDEYYEIVTSFDDVSEVIEDEMYIIDDKILTIEDDLYLLENNELGRLDERLELIESEIDLLEKRLELFEYSLTLVGLYEESDQDNSEVSNRELSNAISKAEEWSELLFWSKVSIAERLVEIEKFPEDIANQAVEEMNADFNDNALNTARNWSDLLNWSNATIWENLQEVEGFTEEEADYAIENLE